MTNIVLNEYLWAENELDNPSMDFKPGVALYRIAKYYKYHGLQRADISQKLKEYLIQIDPRVSIPKWSDTIDNAVKNAFKQNIIMIDSIPITETELTTIREKLKSSPQQRLAFVLLVMSKYWDTVNPDNNHWVNTSDKDIMNMACIRTSIKRQSEMFSKLREVGLIKFASRVDSLNTKVLFQSDGDIAMEISDLRNLGFQYLNHFGGDFYECKNCGLICKREHANSGRKPVYCHDCARDIAISNRVNSVMRQRSKVNN